MAWDGFPAIMATTSRDREGSAMSAEAPRSTRPAGWTAGRIVLVVLGSIAVLLGAGLLVGGAGVLWADQTRRDADGFLSTPRDTFSTTSYALVSEPIDLLEADNRGARWALSDDVLGDVRLTADGDEAVFIGVARTRDVERYLGGVEHDQVVDVRYDPFSVDYRRTAGGAPASAPGDAGFWTVSTSGTGRQTLDWDVEPGKWSVVVMNVDGSDGLRADITVGANASFLLWLAIGLLLAGLLFLAGGGAMIFAGARHTGAPTAVTTPSMTPPLTATAVPATVYPVGVAGDLQPDVSRWLWLVKWLLAIPHYLVLAFLWIAFTVLTLVAAVAILVTGRYPRGIFDFNLGVLRWTWRVWFYSYWANGTDRYPPFSLGDEPGYPARLEVAYPERLVRWLPLVKWILAIPHLILVGLFVGGWGWGPFGEEWRGIGFAGLVGLLVLIACVVLLFTGRYPTTLFDFALGLDRWSLRVAAYVGLMTDEYPPFRLDMGPHEPGPAAETHDRAHAPA